MMKKRYLLFSLLLVSCQNGYSSSKGNELLIETEKLLAFCNYLTTLEGNVQSTNVETLSTYYYLINADPLTISVRDNSTLVRYNSSEGQIMVHSGTHEYLNGDNTVASSKDYEIQIFYDNQYFYKITNYKDDTSEDKKETVTFDENTIDSNLNIGFPLTEQVNFLTMIYYMGNDAYQITYEGIDNTSITNGILEYTYSLSTLSNGAVSQTISYENKVYIVDSIITKVEQKYSNILYNGGIKGNWNESSITYTFTQGERLVFEGTRLNPSDF